MQVCLFAEFANESLLAHVAVYHVKKLKSISLLNVCHARPVDFGVLHCDHIACTKPLFVPPRCSKCIFHSMACMYRLIDMASRPHL